MRRTALRVVGAPLLAVIAMLAPSLQPASARAGMTLATLPDVDLRVTSGEARKAEIPPGGGGPWHAGRTMGYWGKFTGLLTSETGSYRATCTWLANKKWPTSPKQDPRFLCTVVLAFVTPPGRDPDGMVLQGLVRRPAGNGNLFEYGSARQLVITGGTGIYRGAYGVANIQQSWMISISYNVAPM
jgi:hypothetical protein